MTVIRGIGAGGVDPHPPFFCQGWLMPPTAAAVARGLIIAHLILSPLIFSGGTLEAFETSKAALLAAVALAIAGLGVTGLRPGSARRATAWLREPITLAVLAFAASAAISTATSISPLTSLFGAHESNSGLITVVAYAALFIATRAFCTTVGDARRVLAAVAIATGLSAAFGMVQALHIDPFLWAEPSEVAGFVRPFAGQGHANFLAAYLVTALPAVIAVAVFVHGRGDTTSTLILAAVAVGAFLVVVATLSRGSWVALAATALIAAFAVRRHIPARWWALPVFCMLVAAVMFRGGVVERVMNFSNSAGRFDLWRVGMEMYRDHPVAGVGLDGYQTAFGQYRPVSFWKLEWNATPNKAHNEFIHILATQGTLGGIAAIALVAALAIALRRAWQRGNAETRVIVAAAGLGAFAFLVQNLFSFTVAGCGPLFVTLAAILARSGTGFVADNRPAPEWRPAIFASLAITGIAYAFDGSSVGVAEGWKVGAFAAAMALSGVWTAHSVWREGDGVGFVNHFVAAPLSWRLTGYGLAGACAVVGWFGVVQPYRADRLCRSADTLSMADPVAAVALYEDAVAAAPMHDVYWAKLAEGCRKVETRPTANVDRRQYGDRALAAANEAVRLAPTFAPRLALRGQVLSDLAFDKFANPDDAITAYSAALALDPRNAAMLAEAARAAWGLNRFETARDYLQRGSAIDSSQANLVALRGSVAMAEGHFEEADAHFNDAKSLDWHGEEDARLHALSSWGACLARLNRPADSEAWVQYVLERRPDWIPPRFTLAFAMTLSKRPEAAAAEFRQIIAAAPNHPLAAESKKWLERLEKK